jgi:transposase InsO family protein
MGHMGERNDPEPCHSIRAYIEIFYNRQRDPRALDYQTPAEAQAAYQARSG